MSFILFHFKKKVQFIYCQCKLINNYSISDEINFEPGGQYFTVNSRVKGCNDLENKKVNFKIGFQLCFFMKIINSNFKRNSSETSTVLDMNVKGHSLTIRK